MKQDVAVLSRTGKRLMPTSRARARKLLKSGRAVIETYQPFFTIRLTDREDGNTQPMELKVDTGYLHIGLSVCSEKEEHISRQYDLLSDETEKHHDRAMYRRTRRSRLRYRKPRFQNRRGMICRDGFAPSIRNKRDRHTGLIIKACQAFPITNIYIEMGQFDTQVLKAVMEGRPIPKGEGYQQGEQYGFATLRETVFTRDDYTCQVCGRSIRDKAILHTHHIGYRKGDRTDRPGNLLTVCEKCHTSKNHQPGGKLYDLQPKLKPLKEATFMTMVRWNMWDRLKTALPEIRLHMTYGAATKLARRDLHLKKNHATDAYAMGIFHPVYRAHTEYYIKRRRNNRCLEKFYDAVYLDSRDGKKKKASALGCNRTKRNIPRDNPQNERSFRGAKQSAGKRSIRRRHYLIQPGTVLRYQGRPMVAKGVHNKGMSIRLDIGKDVSPKKVTVIRLSSGWIRHRTLREVSLGDDS